MTLEGRVSMRRSLGIYFTAGQDIYICGPAPMVEAFRLAFIAKGVPAGKIHYEEFNFR